METYFASPERTSKNELKTEIKIVSENPIVSGLLQSVSGLLAVLDENRQIVALNDSFLKMLGIQNSENALGLRPGEALQCIHAQKEPAGCGTSNFCSTCGAAIAIVSSLEKGEFTEKTCALTANRDGEEVDIALLVKSHPIEIDRKKFLLLFLQDITRQQLRASLERTFFHDINNMLVMLVGASELLVDEEPSELAGMIHQASIRLMKEVSIQKYLFQNESSEYLPVRVDVTTKQIIDDIQSFFVNHPAGRNKTINIAKEYPDISFSIDTSLLLRILCNMVINALEATSENGEIRIWLELKDHFLSFCVWNDTVIPRDVSRRVFQRNYSTKEQTGRGIGTYSMKLLGEKFLGGKVTFATSEKEGTVFKFTYPV